jgi:phosphatidate cytidylyltransferase
VENKTLQQGASKNNAGLKHRLLSAFILGPLLLLLVKGGNWTFLLLIIGISARSAWEWCRICTNAGHKPNSLLSILLATGLIPCLHWMGPQIIYLYTIVATMLLFSFSLLRGTRNYLSNTLLGIGAMMYAGLLGSSPLLLVKQVGELNHFYNLIIALFFCIWLTDSFAYFCGRKWGNKKLAPSISPNKTVVGLFGGMVGSVIPLGFYPYLPELAPLVLLGMFIFVGLGGQIGDLVESAIKRDMGNIKDAPPLIPGHGGLLDRFDSYFFAFPVAFVYLKIIALFGF